VIERYLSVYAEAGAKTLLKNKRLSSNCYWPQADSKQVWQGCLIIPAFDESFADLDRQLGLLNEANVLVILVINAPIGADAEPIRRTEELLAACLARKHPHVMVLDHVSKPHRLNPKQGVGLARKIGCDLGLALYFLGRIHSPWLLQSDADVAFPQGYSRVFWANTDGTPDKQLSHGALIFPHTHHSDDPALHLAASLYDLHMAYYVAGLSVAGSPYAHHSLGSTIAVHADAYAGVRGYPRRSAGEDFYLLNKVRKIAPIKRLLEPTLTIQARLSSRVPFGTGPALQRIIQSLAEDPSGNGYLSYHPTCFTLLARAINALDQWAIDQRAVDQNHVDDDPILGRLQTLGFEHFAKQMSQQKTTTGRRQQSARDWFDGLKTLQFVRSWGDTYPDQPLQQTVANLPPNFQSKVFEFQTNTD
jgi:hypothetical protein